MVDNEQKASKILHNGQIFIIRLPTAGGFFIALFSSYVVHCPACHAAYIKICTEKSEISQNSHISHVIFLHDKLDKVDKVLLPVCQVCQVCQLCQCIFLHRQLFRMISGSSSFFISVAHLQQPTCFQSLVIS